MRDKERLLSLHEPVGFVVSHSALREGWDNPNVFQICALGSSRSARRRRQEIGRGLRLCVDQTGVRVRDPAVDVLTVIADEDYESFVSGLQSEEADDFASPERTPIPRRAGLTPDAAAPAVPAGPARAPVVPVDLVRQVLARMEPLPRTRVDPAPRGSAVDLVIDALLRRPCPTLVSRATVLDILGGLPDPGALAAAPHAVAARIADAIASVVLGEH